MPITLSTDVSTLTAEDIRPYLSHLRAFLREDGHTDDGIDATIAGVLDAPSSYAWTLGRFRTWLDETRREDEPLPTADRSALGEALAAMRRRERDAKADAHQARLDLVQARQEAIRAREAAALPFNAEHPGWHDFWLEAARNATRSGHCPEYDRHAELMGGITRDQFRADGISLYDRERVTYDITVTITTDQVLENGEDWYLTDASDADVIRWVYDNRYDASVNVEEQDRQEDSEY